MNTRAKRQRSLGLIVVVWASLLTAVASLAAPSVRQAKVTAGDGAIFDQSGIAVALDGDMGLVGAYWDDDQGSVYVFTRSDGVWTQGAKLTAGDGEGYHRFGRSVDLDGDTALIGDYNSAYVFTRSGGVWRQQAKLTASDGTPSGDLGLSVALDGDTALVGDNGSAYVFVRSAGGWTQQARLTASDGAANDLFGYSVALDGHTALVGAYGDDDLDFNAGSVYVFTPSSSVWTQQAKLTARDGAAFDAFGFSVVLGGDIVLVGAPGDGQKGPNAGSTYIFTRSGGVWTQQGKLTAGDGAAGDFFGTSVALDGDTAWPPGQ
jgi:hypothetical protein